MHKCIINTRFWKSQFVVKFVRVNFVDPSFVESSCETHDTTTDQTTENGRRTFANLGIGHLWQIRPEWSVDMRVERSQTLRANEVPFDADVDPLTHYREITQKPAERG